MAETPSETRRAGARPRVAIVLAGGGARGAYEAGVLSYLFEHVYPRLREDFEFDVVSGTSVGAIHAAYVAASAHLRGEARSRRIVDTWRGMEIGHVLRLSARDLVGVPLRALGLSRLVRGRGLSGGEPADAVGGLVDLTPLEHLVETRIPWDGLRKNLDARRPGAVCVSCTEVRSGRITVFMDGPMADPEPWTFDPNAIGVKTALDAHHVRASAAIPFLFPSVRVGDRYYVDGGVRLNTPLSPALRLGAERVLVVALKHSPGIAGVAPAYAEEVITQPAFLVGKVLNALLLDQLEYELQRVDLVNAWIEQGTKSYGEGFLDTINQAVRAQRGAGYQLVRTAVIRPSEDVGHMAGECYREHAHGLGLGGMAGLLARLALRGVPEEEADLLSYLLFDRCFTERLVEMGREDARGMEDELYALLAGEEDA